MTDGGEQIDCNGVFEQRPRVVMLLANPYTHDTRVHKQAQSLIGWGLEVHVVCIAKPQLPAYEIKDGVHVHRVAVKDESVLRVLRGVARLGSRDQLRDWLDQDFSLDAPPPEPLVPTPIETHAPPTTAVSADGIARVDEIAESKRLARIASIQKQRELQARKLERSEQKHTSHDQKITGDLNAKMAQGASDQILVARSGQTANTTQQQTSRARWKWWLRMVIKRIPSAVRIIGFNDELARKAKTLEPDLVLSHDCNTLLAGRMLKTVIGCPLVYDSHELFLECNIGSPRRWVGKLCWWPIERGCIKSADAVFTVAEGIARHLEKRYGIDEVFLLRNVQPYERPPAGVDIGDDGTLIHQELGLDPQTRIVMYPGAITINRGLEFLIQAGPLLDNAVVVVMGYANSDGYMEQLVEMARSNGSLDTTFFFKDAVPIDEVGRWVACADLGVVPTQGVCLSYRFEASNKMFHCLMAGVPLAMSDHPEKRILADRYEVGIVFDETSAESIAQTVNETLNDQDALDRMRVNCLEAAKTLNWEHEEHRYLGVYAGLLPNHDRRVPGIHIGSETHQCNGLGAGAVEVAVQSGELRVGPR